MAKVIRFIKIHFQWVYVVLALLLIALFFLPLYDTTRSRPIYMDIPPEYEFFFLSKLSFFKPNTIIIICAIVCSMTIILSLLNAVLKKRIFIICSVCFTALFCGFVIIYVIGQLGSVKYPSAIDWAIRYSHKPLSAFYLAIVIVVLNFIALIIDELFIKTKNIYVRKVRHPKPKKQKPLKPEERIEILELKLQISELEKQIQESKKDG